MADLTDPSERYQDSYLEALQEFQAEGRHLELALEEVAAHFGDFVQRLREQAPGRVPYSYFWLIDGNDYIGRLILRYQVNEYLLKMGGHIGYEIRPSLGTQGLSRDACKWGSATSMVRRLGSE